MKLKVYFANPRGCNVYGFVRGMSIDAVKNESGAIISDTEIEKEIESEDNSETDEEDSIS